MSATNKDGRHGDEGKEEESEGPRGEHCKGRCGCVRACVVVEATSGRVTKATRGDAGVSEDAIAEDCMIKRRFVLLPRVLPIFLFLHLFIHELAPHCGFSLARSNRSFHSRVYSATAIAPLSFISLFCF